MTDPDDGATTVPADGNVTPKPAAPPPVAPAAPAMQTDAALIVDGVKASGAPAQNQPSFGEDLR